MALRSPPLNDHLHAFFVDHGLLRCLYSNRFRLPGGLHRSNQPSTATIFRLKRRLGIRAVVNLRGRDARKLAFHRLVSSACARVEVPLYDTTIWSRGLLFREQLIELVRLIEGLELPTLVHCKSGADRAGFFSVLYRHIRLGEPIEDAISELSWRYGHFSQAATGVLDHFFRTYLKTRRARQGFLEWVEQDYDREAVQASFKPSGFMRWLVDAVLRRE